MTVRSPTATLDEGWDSLLAQQPAQAVEPMTAVAEALADIVYFYESGLEDDAVAMYEDLKRRNPDAPELVVAPWERAEAPAEVSDDAKLELDEVDILAALDMLDEDVPDEDVPDGESNGFHDAVTVVEPTPAPTEARDSLSVTGTLDYPLHGEALLVDPGADAPAWFDDALAILDELEAEPTMVKPCDEWDIVFDDDDDDLEVEIDTAEFDAPSPVETLSYLPRDLTEMRAAFITGSVTETMPYTEHDRPDLTSRLTLIRGGQL